MSVDKYFDQEGNDITPDKPRRRCDWGHNYVDTGETREYQEGVSGVMDTYDEDGRVQRVSFDDSSTCVCRVYQCRDCGHIELK